MTACSAPGRTTLVTGAAGFVGSHVARHLSLQGLPVRVLLRSTSSLLALADLPVERVEGDLRDVASLDRALRGVSRVIHVAADYRLWCRNPQEIYENNVTGTRNLLEAAGRAGIDKFVYTSTVATIAVHRPGSLPNEETKAGVDEMIGHYKRSKFMAEQEALRAAANGLPVVIVNPTAPVGPGDWKPTPTGRIILDFLNGKMPAYVDTGLNFVAVEDVAAGHELAAERGRIGERYILGGRNMTLKNVLDALAKITGIPRRACVCRMPWLWPPPMAINCIRAWLAASRRFRLKACACLAIKCGWKVRKRRANWDIRPVRLKGRSNELSGGIRSMVT